jgi:small subunit ribosomal protein S20
MANTRSAEKNVRKTKVRTIRNKATKNRVRTVRRRVLAALETGDLKAAEVAMNKFASVADKAAKVNVIHKKTAQRLKSRVAAKLSAAAKK